ncbi:MAG: flavin reductase family protein, partial [Sinobacteraceae bacterium]|nr:flavin reductase family protein [Nevskiaceae bacterium]
AGMRRLAAAVCLITSTTSAGEKVGLTATAVCSVSAEPPTLLCCINRGSLSHAAIRAAGIFAINVLALEDRGLADRFSSPHLDWEARFQAGIWLRLNTGAPILESALAAFDCRITQAVDVGTHGILFGEIQAMRVRQTTAKSLLYAHGSYGGFMSYLHEQSAQLLWMPPWQHDPGG